MNRVIICVYCGAGELFIIFFGAFEREVPQLCRETETEREVKEFKWHFETFCLFCDETFDYFSLS
jgi:hypothetical protein